MIYLDTSVLLAELFAEDRRPPTVLWSASLVTSRLAEYELWTRVHARKLAASHATAAQELLARLSMVELSPLTLRRALEAFPEPVRTLDALHLASLDYLRSQRLSVRLATYDARMARAATQMGFALESLG
jgi:predicted nucleic acid-binding protein